LHHRQTLVGFGLLLFPLVAEFEIVFGLLAKIIHWIGASRRPSAFPLSAIRPSTVRVLDGTNLARMKALILLWYGSYVHGPALSDEIRVKQYM
jgi:hypothetical protein